MSLLGYTPLLNKDYDKFESIINRLGPEQVMPKIYNLMLIMIEREQYEQYSHLLLYDRNGSKYLKKKYPDIFQTFINILQDKSKEA